jgi:hypothetical protein
MEPRLMPTSVQIIVTDYFAQNLFIMIFGPCVIYLMNFLMEGGRVIFIIFIAALCAINYYNCPDGRHCDSPDTQ